MATGGRIFDDAVPHFGTIGGTHANLEVTTGSVGGWVKNLNEAVAFGIFECLSAGFQGYRLAWERGGFAQRLTMYDGTDWRFSAALAGGALGDGNWHHIMLTFVSGGNVKFYVDGVQSGTTATAGTIGTAGGATKYFGRDDSTYMDAEASEWAHWENTVLSDAEVAALAGGDSPQAHGCEHHWRFNGTGTTVADEVGDCDITLSHNLAQSSNGPAVDEPGGADPGWATSYIL